MKYKPQKIRAALVSSPARRLAWVTNVTRGFSSCLESYLQFDLTLTVDVARTSGRVLGERAVARIVVWSAELRAVEWVEVIDLENCLESFS